jgi:glycosyltransferase A (GT-A) superfamily protein (DUF2064 family)
MKRTLLIVADPDFGLTEPLASPDALQGQLVEAGLKDTIARCDAVRPGAAATLPQLHLVYPDRRDWYAQITSGSWLLVPRLGSTLAQCLDNALLFVAPEPEDETLFVGVRTPHLTTRAFEHALIGLSQRGACVGPTPSGGVYAVGIRGRWPTGVLQQVRWHDGHAAADLRHVFRQLRIGVALLEEMQPLTAASHVQELVASHSARDRDPTPFLDQLARRLAEA